MPGDQLQLQRVTYVYPSASDPVITGLDAFFPAEASP